jgi:hypothetical protein
MSNSRSQTKIRKTQQVNLLAEERYLRQKGLLSESTIEDFMECFDANGLTMDQIPQSCRSINNKEEFVKCKNDINTAMVSMGRPSGQSFESLFVCLETKAMNLGLLVEPVTPEEEPPSEEEVENPEEEK